MKLITGLAVLAATASLAHAGGKAKPGLQHNPPRFIDESTAWIAALGQSDSGYLFRGQATVVNSAEGDRVRLEWTQKGKVLGTAKCKWTSNDDRDANAARVECSYSDKPLKATGPIEANLIYEDDKDDTEWLLRTFKFEMKAWDKVTWQIAADDLLGAAYAWHGYAGQTDDVPIFRFWVANDGGFDGQLRCTVGGQKLPDYNFSAQVNNGELEADVLPAKGERKTWKWQLTNVTPAKLHFGPAKKGDTFYDYLGAHPGDWDCQVRKAGVVVRELLFKVNAQGRIESAPWQAAAKDTPLKPSVAAIEVHIPKDNGLDKRVKPDLLKKSRGWGMPWPADPGIKTMLAALPAAYENANPVAAKPKGSGKLMDGLAHTPPRFVDESTTELRLARDMAGYSFYAFARVAGVNGAQSDQFRLDWKAGGKVVSTAKCEWNEAGRSNEDKSGHVAQVSCAQQDKPVTAKGAIEAQLVYHDDEDGNDYLVRTYKVTVAKFTSFGDPVWQIVPDDVLGAAYAHHNAGDPLDTVGWRLVLFAWFARSLDGAGDMALRCSVDGKKLDKDLKVRAEGTPGGFEVKADPYTKDGKHTTYTWTHAQIDTDIYVGPKSNKSISKDQREYSGMLADHPGKWDCALRNEGKVIRQLLFTVSPDGWVQPSGELATGKGAVPTLPWVAPIEVRIPKDSKFDERIRPDAMKKSRGFGLPWPEGPSIKATQASFPPASGLADPR